MGPHEALGSLLTEVCSTRGGLYDRVVEAPLHVAAGAYDVNTPLLSEAHDPPLPLRLKEVSHGHPDVQGEPRLQGLAQDLTLTNLRDEQGDPPTTTSAVECLSDEVV